MENGLLISATLIASTVFKAKNIQHDFFGRHNPAIFHALHDVIQIEMNYFKEQSNLSSELEWNFAFPWDFLIPVIETLMIHERPLTRHTDYSHTYTEYQLSLYL